MAKTKQFIPKSEVYEMAMMKQKGYSTFHIAKHFRHDLRCVQYLLVDFFSPYRNVNSKDAGATNTKDDSTLRIRCHGCGYKVSRVCKSAPTTCMGCHMKQSSQVLTKTVLRRF